VTGEIDGPVSDPTVNAVDEAQPVTAPAASSGERTRRPRPNKVASRAIKYDKPPSDHVVALYFAEQNAEHMRFVAEFGKWLIWDDTRWRFDRTLAAADRARRACSEIAGQCKEPRSIESYQTIGAVEKLARSDRRLAAIGEQWDADPWLLNTLGGTIDLHTGVCRAHRRADYITKITGAAPDADCPIPMWEGFLRRITNNDAELIEYLQRVAGYALTGSTEEHAIFFLYGTGNNGKSTFLSTLIAAIGEYHRTAPIETFIASKYDQHPTDIASLRDARLVTATETEEGRRWAESRIKTLTGGDKVTARFMRQDFFEFTPVFKLIIAGNHKPGLASVNEAMRRRINLIPFTVKIPENERVADFSKKLAETELPGILQWMIDGCLKWQEHGLKPPESVTKATAAYLEAEDSFSAWLAEFTERDANAWTKSAKLFESWSAFATKTGEYVGNQKRFSQNMESHHFIARRKETARGFDGIKLKEAASLLASYGGGESAAAGVPEWTERHGDDD
jgi:putative DNA primase/helicase